MARKAKDDSPKAIGAKGGKSAAEKRMEAANRRTQRQRAKGGFSSPVPF